MATRVLLGFELFDQTWKGTFQGTSLPSLIKIGEVVKEEKKFEEIVDGRSNDGRQTSGHHKSSPWALCAQVS